ncbi:MAG: hypothetical protein GF347_03895 [Candidatus Moranbacteria bacterium]|nr:hypothetical protein [Candidatus Moranbacteria bacterium]
MDIKRQNNLAMQLDLFVEALIKAKGFDKLDEKIARELRFDLTNRLINRIISEILNVVPVEQLEELEKLIFNNDTGGIVKFVDKNVSNKADLLNRVLLDFKRLYIGK